MMYSLGFAALAALAVAAPTETEKKVAQIQPRAACTTAVKLTAGTNPFSGKSFYANEYYKGEIATAMADVADASIKAQGTKVGEIGTFLWM